jgi:hypothetical protein
MQVTGGDERARGTSPRARGRRDQVATRCGRLPSTARWAALATRGPSGARRLLGWVRATRWPSGWLLIVRDEQEAPVVSRDLCAGGARVLHLDNAAFRLPSTRHSPGWLGGGAGRECSPSVQRNPYSFGNPNSCSLVGNETCFGPSSACCRGRASKEVKRPRQGSARSGFARDVWHVGGCSGDAVAPRGRCRGAWARGCSCAAGQRLVRVARDADDGGAGDEVME